MNKSFSIAQWAASAFIVGAVMLGLVPLFWFAASHGGLQALRFDHSISTVLLFTLKQALLSTVISISLGLLAARALARRNFWGKGVFMSLFAVPFALPAIVAVLGISGVYGNLGWLGGIVNIYGLAGILLVHIFFNLPLAAKVFHEALANIAPDNFKLAAQLSFSDREVFLYVEWPVIRSALPGIFSLIFLLCAASFVVVLTLGGPSATTLEVAIYQSLRMDFDVGRALALSVLQIILCLILVALAGRMVLQQQPSNQSQLGAVHYSGHTMWPRIFDGAAIIVAMIIVLPPLFVVVVDGLFNLTLGWAVFSAAGFSLVIGSGAALLALSLAWPIAQMRHAIGRGLALAGLIVPPAVIATGWFLALKGFDVGLSVTMLTVIALNGLMALPFSVAVLHSRFGQIGLSHDRLCEQLGVTGWNRFWRIDVPFMLPSLRQAGLLAFVMSLGDLTAVTLLGSQGLITLPALIHLQMGNYRSTAAAGTALLLTVSCYGLALIAQRLGRVQ